MVFGSIAGNDRFREHHRLEDDLIVLVRRGYHRWVVFFRPTAAQDLSSEHLFALFAIVCVHLKDAPDALFVDPWSNYRYSCPWQAFLNRLGNTSAPDVRVGDDLEGKRRERLLQIGAALDLFTLLAQAFDRRYVERRGEVLDDRIEQRLNAFVLEG